MTTLGKCIVLHMLSSCEEMQSSKQAAVKVQKTAFLTPSEEVRPTFITDC